MKSRWKQSGMWEIWSVRNLSLFVDCLNQSVTALFVLYTVAVVGLTSKGYNNINIDVSNIDITEASRIFPEVCGKA